MRQPDASPRVIAGRTASPKRHFLLGKNMQRHALAWAIAIGAISALFFASEIRAQDDSLPSSNTGPSKSALLESGPRAIVSTFQDTLLATMKDAKSLGFEGRYRRLLPAMNLAFDFHRMTRVIVGQRWDSLDRSQQEQMVDLFRQFSVATYAAALSTYGSEKFEIGNSRIRVGIGTIIETSLVSVNEPPVQLNYLLQSTPAGWRIVDVYLAGTISELARRREEFGSVIHRQGIDGLIALLKRKSDELSIN